MLLKYRIFLILSARTLLSAEVIFCSILVEVSDPKNPLYSSDSARIY
jgi:hypothetical protein